MERRLHIAGERTGGIAAVTTVKALRRKNLESFKGSLAYKSGFLIVSTVIGNALGWGYQIFMGRSLGVEMFGLFSGLLGVFYIAMLGATALRVQVAVIIASTAARYGDDAAARTCFRICRNFVLILLPVMILYMIEVRPIASFFHTASTGAIAILGLAIFSTAIFQVVLGFLQGMQRFKALAYVGYVLPPALKLMAGAAFIALGWRLLGAMGALALAEFTGLFAALVVLRNRMRLKSAGETPAGESMMKIVLNGAVLAFFMAAPTNLDVPIVLHYFGAADSGIYACAATFGKVITFLPLGISLVMLPLVSGKHALNQPAAGLARQSLLLTFILSGVTALCFWLFPGFFIRGFLGKDYLGAAGILGWYGTAMVFFSLNLVLAQYAVAVGRNHFTYMAGAVMLALMLTIFRWHVSLPQVIGVMLGGNLLLLLLFIPLWWKRGSGINN